jgi:hypothetical protein
LEIRFLVKESDEKMNWIKSLLNGSMKNGSPTIGGFEATGLMGNESAFQALIDKIARRVIELSPTELDLYRYIMEEADRFSVGNSFEKEVLLTSGFQDLEYDGESQKIDQFKKHRKAINYIVGPEQCRLIRRRLAFRVHGQDPIARMNPSRLP